jgi:translocation and assembly module TamB
LSATRDGRRIALVQPASVRAVAGGFQTERFTLGVNGGQVTLAGTAGDSLDLTVDVHRLPLATADIFAPGTGLTGTLDASARISGRAATPSGTYQLRATGVSVPALRAASVPPLSIDANGRVQDNRIGIEARIAAGATGTATVSGTAPLGDGDLALNARGRLEAGLLNALLAGSGRRVGGRVDIDTTLRGEPSAPQIGGSAIVTGGNFSDPVAGVAITGIDGRITGAGRQVIIERLTGRTRNGGTISATGRIDADPARGFPGALQIRSTASELVSNGVVRVVAALNLSVNGPLAAAPRIAGRVDVETIDVSVPERFGGAAAPLPNTRHIRPPPQTQARLAKQQRATGAAQRATPPFNAFLDITVDAPARIFVRGRGIDAELGGQIRLAGSTAAPQADGSFDLRRGRLVVLTQRLDFSRGRLLFQGSPIPDLDFVAETRAGGVTARVNVTGPANAPTFAFNSDPDLPQDEVLSRLLFARASGGLSAFQALQLAQAAAQFSGAGGDLDAFERTRRTLGVDDLDVNFGPAGPTVGVSRAIGDRVRLGVRAGARPEDSAVGVDIDLTRRLKLQGEVGADGRTSVGAGFEIEW